jgi:hypothetical protein
MLLDQWRLDRRRWHRCVHQRLRSWQQFTVFVLGDTSTDNGAANYNDWSDLNVDNDLICVTVVGQYVNIDHGHGVNIVGR